MSDNGYLFVNINKVHIIHELVALCYTSLFTKKLEDIIHDYYLRGSRMTFSFNL